MTKHKRAHELTLQEMIRRQNPHVNSRHRRLTMDHHHAVYSWTQQLHLMFSLISSLCLIVMILRCDTMKGIQTYATRNNHT